MPEVGSPHRTISGSLHGVVTRGKRSSRPKRIMEARDEGCGHEGDSTAGRSFFLLVAAGTARLALGDANPANVLTGQSAFVSLNTVKPGLFREDHAFRRPAEAVRHGKPPQRNRELFPDRKARAAPCGCGLQGKSLHDRFNRAACDSCVGAEWRRVCRGKTRAGRIRVFHGMAAGGKAGAELHFCDWTEPTVRYGVLSVEVRTRNGCTSRTSTRWCVMHTGTAT